MTVGDFTQRIIEDIKYKFKVNADPNMKIDELLTQKFEIEVNKETYTVLPNLISMIPIRNKGEVTSAFESRYIP